MLCIPERHIFFDIIVILPRCDDINVRSYVESEQVASFVYRTTPRTKNK